MFVFKQFALPLGVGVALLLSIAPATSTSLSIILPLRSARYGTSFDVEIQIGTQTFQVLADTGSADLWVLDSNWHCFRGSSLTSNQTAPLTSCNYGNKTYTQSPTFEPITNAWFGEHYGSGDDIGTLGFENIQLGNITIPRQEMGFVNRSNDVGDRINTGIMGLGYPVLAGIHPAGYIANSSLQLLENRWTYDTVFVNLVKQGFEPYFSFALERTPLAQETGFGGYLALGTLPPVAHGEFTTTPVEVTDTIPAFFTNGTGKISEWTLTVQAVTGNGKTNSTQFQAVVDTGNWMNQIPPEIAASINAGFDPPAVLDSKQGVASVPCNATPPSNVGIQIGGKMFSMDSDDMIWQDSEGSCYSSFGPLDTGAGITLSFLGDAFLKNVVAVFDVGRSEMRFAERLGSNSTTASPAASTTPSTGGAGKLDNPTGLFVATCIALLAFM